MEILTGIKSIASDQRWGKNIQLFSQFRNFSVIHALNYYSRWGWIDKKQHSHKFSLGKIGGLKIMGIFSPLNKTFFTCSVTPGNFARIRWSCSLILLIYSSAPGRPASHSYCGPEPPRAPCSSQPRRRWMGFRSSSCGWRRVQEAGAEQGHSSKWQKGRDLGELEATQTG